MIADLMVGLVVLAVGPVFLLVHVFSIKSKVDATWDKNIFYVFDVTPKVCA